MTTEITRRLRNGMVGEHVLAWHYRSEGPGDPGGRSYDVLYASDGRIRIDVSGCWGSVFHTVWLKADEVRPQEEWRMHLLATGQRPVVRRWCTVDGMELPSGSDPEVDENCCSPECRSELRTG